MADSVRNEDFEANENDLAILPVVNAQGYLYEQTIQHSDVNSDDSSDEESTEDDTDIDDQRDSDRVGNTDW